MVTDGSTDGSENIAAGFAGITVLHQPERQGKAAAINRAAAEAKHEVLLLTDANTFLNPGAVSAIVESLNNPSVGAVCGEKRVQPARNHHYGESVYWKYESALKKQESRSGSVVGAAGELLVIRKSLFEPIPEEVILDDFYLSMQVTKKGFCIAYQPLATATELPPQNLSDEFTRRTRIAAGVWQWMKKYCSPGLFKNNPFFFWQFFSHRLCRWFIAPVCLVLLIVSGTVLFCADAGFFYTGVFGAGVLFSLLAVIGALPLFQHHKPGVFGFPFYFIFTHICLLWGYAGYIRGKHSVLWKKLSRSNG